MLAEILGGGTTSYFAEKLQFDTPIATYSAAFYNGQALDDTTFNVIVVPQPGVTLQEAEDAMDAAITSFMKKGVDPDQLDRIKQQIRAEQIYARDDADSVANRYGSALAIGLTVQDVQDWPDVLEAVTAEDIMQAAKDVFNREASVTGWLMREEVTE